MHNRLRDLSVAVAGGELPSYGWFEVRKHFMPITIKTTKGVNFLSQIHRCDESSSVGTAATRSACYWNGYKIMRETPN